MNSGVYMLVLLPKLFNNLVNLIKNIKGSYRTPSLAMASTITALAFIFSIIPVANAKETKYETKIKLDPTTAALIVPNRTVSIAVGRSNDDLRVAGLKHDPFSIKVLIQEYAPKYGVDWRLVYAIGYLESGNFNSSLARNQNNFFGRKARSGGWASWSTPAEAIRNQFEYLRTRYIDRGMDTPYEMNAVYAESPTWGAKVTGIMMSL